MPDGSRDDLNPSHTPSQRLAGGLAPLPTPGERLTGAEAEAEIGHAPGESGKPADGASSQRTGAENDAHRGESGDAAGGQRAEPDQGNAASSRIEAVVSQRPG